MINSSAEIQPHCLSAEFAFRQTSHYYMCFFTLLQKPRKKLFSQIDSLSALADTMDEKFPYRTEPKGPDICCKKFFMERKILKIRRKNGKKI